MSKKQRLHRKLSNFSLKDLTFYIIIGQTFTFILSYAGIIPLSLLELQGGKILNGEIWRLVTFLFIPPLSNVYFMIFALYLFYLYGSTLEAQWGAFKYNLYILIGALSAILLSFVFPNFSFSNIYILSSVMYAFAYLFPDFELRLFFILPIKIKWLALISAVPLFYNLIVAGVPVKILILTSFSNFLIFFTRPIYRQIRYRGRKATHKAKIKRAEKKILHQCSICGKDDKSFPQMEFRYDDNDQCICLECLKKQSKH